MTAPGSSPPDEWVEAAARAYFLDAFFAAPPPSTWDAEPDDVRDSYRETVRPVLAAVLPLVAAERDRAVRDALTEAARRVAAEAAEDKLPELCHAARIVADLRDGATEAV